MRNLIRLGVIVALALGASGARADGDPNPATGGTPQAEVAFTGASSGNPDPGSAEALAGAGGMEPQQAVDEEPVTSGHQDWVESVWVSP